MWKEWFSESARPYARPLDRTVAWSLLALSLVLVVSPLTSRKPGTPATLKADEPAYYLAALSLVRDFDLRCETEDLQRLFVEYPYAPTSNLILASGDGWRTLFYGKPMLYPLLAAPLAGLFGANGLVLFNALLVVAMLWLGTLFLRQYNSDGVAALFTVGFFLCSTTWTYVYWLHPEILNMFAVTGCLFFGLYPFAQPSPGQASPGQASPGQASPGLSRPGLSRPGLGGRLRRCKAALFNPNTQFLWSGALLALGTYNKPMVALMGLPIVVRALVLRRFRDVVGWCLGTGVTLGAIALIAIGLTGQPTAYLGVDRTGVPVISPEKAPIEPAPPPPPGQELGKTTAGWWWLLRVPDTTLREVAEGFRYFLFGRHTGLFLYQPFALLALALFLLNNRRAPVGWSVLAALAAVAFFFIDFIPFNWQGGGGFVGNRYFLMAYPGFLFLVTRIRPVALTTVGYVLGGLFVGPLLFAPLGAVVPAPTLQYHMRNAPFQLFPLELSLREIPGYEGVVQDELWFFGRKDHFRVVEGEFWFQGADPAEMWIQSAEPVRELSFEVRSLAPENAISLTVEGAAQQLVVGRLRQRVSFAPSGPTLTRAERDPADFRRLVEVYLYRLRVVTSTGELPSWRQGEGGPTLYLGAILTYAGKNGRDKPKTGAPGG